MDGKYEKKKKKKKKKRKNKQEQRTEETDIYIYIESNKGERKKKKRKTRTVYPFVDHHHRAKSPIHFPHRATGKVRVNGVARINCNPIGNRRK